MSKLERLLESRLEAACEKNEWVATAKILCGTLMGSLVIEKFSKDPIDAKDRRDAFMSLCDFIIEELNIHYYERSFILSFMFYRVIKAQNQIGNEYLYVFNKGNSFYDWIGLDNPGCDIPPFVVNGKHRDCLRRCCAKHDECYFSRNGTSPGGKCRCTAGSWSMNIADVYMRMKGAKDLFGDDPCKKCNSDVVSCFKSCYVGKEGDGPRWFCPNGDYAGETYNRWEDIPASCFESGQKPYWPPDEDPPPLPPAPYYRPSIPEVFNAIMNLQ